MQGREATMLPLNATVHVKLTGTVVARTESTDRPDTYLVEYEVNGKPVREWMRGERLQEVVKNGM